MYEAYFGFAGKPFALLPNPDFLYLSASHRKALTYLEYAVAERAGFMLLTGAIGSGKTTIIRDMINKHRDTFLLSMVSNTNLNPEQLLAMINDDFGLSGEGRDKPTLLHNLNDFLVEQYALGNRPLLIIDEAQNLSIEALEEVRLLSNLETDTAKLLQIVLVGQPELRQILTRPELLQLRQRIAFSCHLQPLAQAEVGEYILHRLEVAGNRNAVTFSAEALALIWRFARGIPRLINIICDYLLLSSFAAESREISADLVNEIVSELEFEGNYWGDGDPQAEVAELGSSVMSNPLQDMLVKLAARIDSLETVDAVALKETLRGITQRLDRCERSERDLHQSMKEVAAQIKSGAELQQATPVSPLADSDRSVEPKKGFFWRLFHGS